MAAMQSIQPAPGRALVKLQLFSLGQQFSLWQAGVGGGRARLSQGGITGTKPREAYGVRGACSRFRTAPHIRQREQAPRTPYASRDTTALVIRLCNLLRIPRKSAQENKIFAYIIQRAAVFSRSWPGALRTDAPYLPAVTDRLREGRF